MLRSPRSYKVLLTREIVAVNHAELSAQAVLRIEKETLCASIVSNKRTYFVFIARVMHFVPIIFAVL